MSGDQKPQNVTCPQCRGPMTSRQNRQTGQRFWGCVRFPNCRGTRDSMGLSAEDKRRAAEDVGDEDYEDCDDDHPGNPRFYGDN